MAELKTEPKRRWIGPTVVLVVVVLALVAGLLYQAPANAPTNQVSEVYWSYTGCWASATGPGGKIATNDQVVVGVSLARSAQDRGCTVETVNSQTTGFYVASVNAPLPVASGTSGVQLTVYLHTTISHYNGPVTLLVAVH
jgi:hypothetical protein